MIPRSYRANLLSYTGLTMCISFLTGVLLRISPDVSELLVRHEELSASASASCLPLSVSHSPASVRQRQPSVACSWAIAGCTATAGRGQFAFEGRRGGGRDAQRLTAPEDPFPLSKQRPKPRN